MRNRKDAAMGPEEQEANYTLITTSSRRAKQDRKIKFWRGLTTKRHVIWPPESWMIDRLKMCKIYGGVIKFIENTMENYWVEQTAGGKTLSEVKIKEGILQEESLSPLLFVIAMMPLTHILRK